MKKIVGHGFFLFILVAQNAWCNAVSDALQAKLNAIGTMNASFNQVVKAQKREVSRSSGTMALSRPGRFRWETKQPMEQLVIADGKHLWIYDIDLEQVTIKKQAQVGGMAALFLSGYGDTVDRDFDVTTYKEKGKEYYDLKSKSNKANFPRVKLMFVGATLNGIELFDQLGQHTDVSLSHIQNNPSLSATLFKFKIPKGVDVVQQ